MGNVEWASWILALVVINNNLKVALSDEAEGCLDDTITLQCEENQIVTIDNVLVSYGSSGCHGDFTCNSTTAADSQVNMCMQQNSSSCDIVVSPWHISAFECFGQQLARVYLNFHCVPAVGPSTQALPTNTPVIGCSDETVTLECEASEIIVVDNVLVSYGSSGCHGDFTCNSTSAADSQVNACTQQRSSRCSIRISRWDMVAFDCFGQTLTRASIDFHCASAIESSSHPSSTSGLEPSTRSTTASGTVTTKPKTEQTTESDNYILKTSSVIIIVVVLSVVFVVLSIVITFIYMRYKRRKGLYQSSPGGSHGNHVTNVISNTRGRHGYRVTSVVSNTRGCHGYHVTSEQSNIHYPQLAKSNGRMPSYDKDSVEGMVIGPTAIFPTQNGKAV